MSNYVVGLTGNYSDSSRTNTLVSKIVSETSSKYGFEKTFYNLCSFGDSLALARTSDQLDHRARTVIQDILDADVLVVGVPTYQASYPGMFKHLFDMVDPHALAGKPVILAATGGTERHALMIEHQLRPLFTYFRTATVATAIYAASSEYDGQQLRDSGLQQRIYRAVDELNPLLNHKKESAKNCMFPDSTQSVNIKHR